MPSAGSGRSRWRSLRPSSRFCFAAGRRLPALRESMDAGANAAVLPAFSVASLVGFGAVVAALPAFAVVRDWVLGIGGGPLVSLAVATNILSALTGSASGGLTIALDALGPTYMRLAVEQGIDPALLHRVAVIGAGTLDSLPHNGAVVTLLAVCGSTHARELSADCHGRDRRSAHRARGRHRHRRSGRIVLNLPREPGPTLPEHAHGRAAGHGVLVGGGDAIAGAPCWIEASSFALSWSALRSGFRRRRHLRHLVSGRRVRHVTRLDSALSGGGGALRERGTRSERQHRETNDEPVA